MSKVLSRNTGILNRLKHFFPSKILLSVYSAIMTPYLTYGILAWGNATGNLINMLFRIKKRAIRNINHVGYLFHTNNLFHENRILKLSDLFYCNVGIFMYNLSTTNLPEIFLQMFRKNRSLHDYPTRQSDAYHLPRTRTVFAQKTIMFTGPSYWNALPLELIESPSLYTFKRKLKERLFKAYLDVNV